MVTHTRGLSLQKIKNKQTIECIILMFAKVIIVRIFRISFNMETVDSAGAQLELSYYLVGKNDKKEFDTCGTISCDGA